jgi:hypothetical protein
VYMVDGWKLLERVSCLYVYVFILAGWCGRWEEDCFAQMTDYRKVC